MISSDDPYRCPACEAPTFVRADGLRYDATGSLHECAPDYYIGKCLFCSVNIRWTPQPNGVWRPVNVADGALHGMCPQRAAYLYAKQPVAA